jgi:hypothetical protein
VVLSGAPQLAPLSTQEDACSLSKMAGLDSDFADVVRFLKYFDARCDTCG